MGDNFSEVLFSQPCDEPTEEGLKAFAEAASKRIVKDEDGDYVYQW